MPAVVTPSPGALLVRGDRHPAGRDAFEPEHRRFDVMELARSPDGGPDYLAARLCYRLMGWLVARQSGK